VSLFVVSPKIEDRDEVEVATGRSTKRPTLKDIQGVSEISALILTGNRTHQKKQLFFLSFWRKTLRNGLKK
jgi:hypothetical protein